MIAEAIDTAVTLGWALAVWIVLLALAAALAVHAVVVAVAVPVGVACRAVTAALAASRALRALGEQPGSPVAPEGRLWPSPGQVTPDGSPATGPRTATAAPLTAELATEDPEPLPASERRSELHTPSWARKDAA